MGIFHFKEWLIRMYGQQITQFSGGFEQARNVYRMQQAMAQQQLGTLGAAPGPGQVGVQSLEQLLYVGTFGDNEAKIITDLQKIPVFNLVHQWTQEQYYGAGIPSAVGLGALPPLNNGYYRRGFAYVKFYADTRMIPQQMLDIEPAVGNLIGRYTTDSFMKLVADVNHDVYLGDSTTNEFSMDGVDAQVKQYAPNNYLDARTAALSPALVEYMSAVVRGNFGDATMNRVYASPSVITPFTINYIQQQRTLPILWDGSGGNPFSQWNAQWGPAMFRDDRFAEFDTMNGFAPVTSFANTAAPQGIPPAPTAAPSVTVNATDANSQWTATYNGYIPGATATTAGLNGTSTGYYAYCYAYRNANGMGIVSPITAVQTVSNGGSVALSGPTSGVGTLSSVRIFRQQLASASDTPSYSGMQAIPEDQAVTVSTSGWTYTDVNADIPGTYKVFFINTSMGGAHLGRLGPMRKYELAPVNLGYWYVVGWWGMLICPVPWWHVVVKNVTGAQIPMITAGYSA